MKLPVPPEPVELKREAKAQKKGTAWNMDSLVLWYGNRLPSYLWNEGGWSEIFKRDECNWQCFLKVLSWHKREIIDWARDSISWNELIKKIEDLTEGIIFRFLADRQNRRSGNVWISTTILIEYLTIFTKRRHRNILGNMIGGMLKKSKGAE